MDIEQPVPWEQPAMSSTKTKTTRLAWTIIVAWTLAWLAIGAVLGATLWRG